MVQSDVEMEEQFTADSVIDSSQPSELDPAQFPCSSIRAPSSLSNGRGSNKRTQTAKETWSHAKKLKPEDEMRDRFGNKYWICARCDWSSTALSSVRHHLRSRHGIKVEAQKPQSRVTRTGETSTNYPPKSTKHGRSTRAAGA